MICKQGIRAEGAEGAEGEVVILNILLALP